MGRAPAFSTDPITLLVVGGGASSVRFPTDLAPGSVVVAADSGLDHVVEAGRWADHLVGDLDSVRPDLVDAARGGGTEVHRHPADKDATDIELALDLIRQLVADDAAPPRLLVVGAGGGRLDHLLADLLALGSPLLADLEVTAHLGEATVAIARPMLPRRIHGAIGEQVSLLPLHGPASGVTTSGLRWALLDAHLAAGTTRAMSNELLESPARVALTEGVIAVVQPGTAAAAIDPRTTPYDPTPRAPGGTP